jgi:hypothetical protein
MVDPTRVPEAPPVFEVRILWSPTGQMQVVFPSIDPTITLGILEMAKAVLNEKRMASQKAQDSGLVLPRVSA